MELQEALNEEPSSSKKLPDIISSHNSDEPSRSQKAPVGEPEQSEQTEYFCSIDPEEIPAVPEKKFLTRVKPEDDMKNTDKDAAEEKDLRSRGKSQSNDSSRREKKKEGEWRIGKDGMKIKGRGTMRFNPYTDRERSVTPPHWKNSWPRNRSDDRGRDKKDNKEENAEKKDRLSAFERLTMAARKDRSERPEMTREPKAFRSSDKGFEKFYRQKEEERREMVKVRAAKKRRSKSGEATRETQGEEKSEAIEEKLMQTLSERIQTEIKDEPFDQNISRSVEPRREDFRRRPVSLRDPIPFRPISPKRPKQEFIDPGMVRSHGLMDPNERTRRLPSHGDDARPRSRSPGELRHPMSGRTDIYRSSKKRRERDNRSPEARSKQRPTEEPNSGLKGDIDMSWHIDKSISERFKAIANYSITEEVLDTRSIIEKTSRVEAVDANRNKDEGKVDIRSSKRSRERKERSKSRDRKEKRRSPNVVEKSKSARAVEKIEPSKTESKHTSSKREKSDKDVRKTSKDTELRVHSKNNDEKIKEPVRERNRSKSKSPRNKDKIAKSRSRSRNKSPKRQESSRSPVKRANRSRSRSREKPRRKDLSPRGREKKETRSNRSRSRDRKGKESQRNDSKRDKGKGDRKREKSSSPEDLFGLSKLV